MLINRNMWSNPLSDVMGNWSMWKVNLCEQDVWWSLDKKQAVKRIENLVSVGKISEY